MSAPRSTLSLLCAGAAALAILGPESASEARGGPCPIEMAYVEGDGIQGGPTVRVCVDRWEGSLIDAATGKARSPFGPLEGAKVRAQSRAGAFPQAYISKVEAEAACKASKKRLCKENEWVRACEGRSPTVFPYGDDEKAGYCNDKGTPPIGALYKDTQAAFASLDAMNDPRLNQLPNTLAKSGSHARCKNSYGLYDMVGNLHEWVDDPDGTFRGGYYLDTHRNGLGCKYKTTAHHVRYHDYSTGFRCCKDPR